MGGGFCCASGGQKNVTLGSAGGIVDVHLHQEPVQLCLGQGVGALLLNGVLRGQHMERTTQGAVLPGNRHLFFLHRLQQRRLRARAGAVDLIGHQKLAKHRAFQKAKGTAAIRGGFQDFRAQNIGRHQIGGELDAVRLQAHHGGQSIDQHGLA